MWRTVKLGDIAKLYQPKTITKSEMTGDGLYPVYGANGIIGRYHDFNHDGEQLVIGCRGSCGEVNVTSGKCWITGNAMVIKPSNDVLLAYLKYYLLQREVTNSVITGTAQPQITRKSLAPVKLLMPPLAEQQRIVAKLDTAFQEIDRAIELAEAKEAEVDNLRASLISSLLTGEEMTASTLGETCRMYQPKTISTKDMVANGDYVVFGANGIIGKYDKYNHEHEQLLVTCRGATCGSVNISQPKSWITGNAMVIQPDLAKVSVRYMEYLFRGGIDLSKAITGSAQPQITRKSLEPIKFSYPSLKEQEHIVETLEVASQELNVFMKHTKSILANYNALKSAILAQELQPQQSGAA